ncbi:N-glycosylase/DNA lyase [Xylophilus ampelinus]|uniref:8-oxoguanine DNA glycosylase n=1 Tax=Variovorax paradoxus TaxID=34073 RepID=A0A2W5STY5_VARPD|nr:MAG: 8-oxoguanine DNA glycosylase [Variovorax paradoxus]VTY30147.1 N-glycosylase/DNA lyase [Xylophilus ampelinus]
MNQTAGICWGHLGLQVELPPADEEVMPGVVWGAVEAFPTPAYWAYQVLARRITCTTISHRLGSDLVHEVAACLLGGYGVPAEVGLAAYRRLRDSGALCLGTGEEKILSLLAAPLDVGGRPVRYRFAAQKSRCLSLALEVLANEKAPIESGRALRDWLTRLPGVGLKTASWIARNFMDADDVAILDIHIVRAGELGGFLDPSLTVERHYLELEAQFLKFSQHLQVKPSELDSVIWLEMKQSPRSVSRLLASKRSGAADTPRQSTHRRSRPHERGADTNQSFLLK